jgi:hypothetical protein
MRVLDYIRRFKMKIITGSRRVMREELYKAGTPKETNEIRESYSMGSLVTSFTHMPENETQNPHKHILVKEAIHVLYGSIEVLSNKKWHPIKERQIAEFDLNEYHNVRTRPNNMVFPHAKKNISAITLAYKWIPAYVNIEENEIDLVLRYDWFHQNYEKNNKDITTSPLLRASKEIQKKFLNVARRNKFI